MVAFCLFIIGPFLIVGWISASKASNAMKEEVGKTMQQLVKQNHATLAKTLSSVRDKTITFLDNQFFSSAKQYEFWTGIDTLGELSEAEAILDRWSTDGTQYTLYMNGSVEKALPFDARYKSTGFIYTNKESPDYPLWAEQSLQEKGGGIVRLTTNGAGLTSVSYTRTILHPEKYDEAIGFLVVSKLEVLLTKDLLSVRLPRSAGIYLFNDQGELLMREGGEALALSSLPEAVGGSTAGGFGSIGGAEAGYYFADEDGGQWLYAYSRETAFHTRLIYRIPVQSIVGSQSDFEWMMLTMSAVYLVFVLLFVLYLIRNIVKPIARLVAFTRIYEPGRPFDFGRLRRGTGRVPSGPDEFGLLYDAFIRMTGRLDQSIEENYGMQIKQKEMELSTLHSQITPHLLYNTLDSIYWYAVDSGVGSMVKDLAKLLRIGLSKGKSLIPVEEELEHARAYVRLQSKRYPGVFEVRWDIDECALPYTIPKVVIQPLVENAIFHGVNSMDGEGVIWIRIGLCSGCGARSGAGAGERDEREVGVELRIEVEDNGFIPVDLQKLERIVEGDMQDKGYGIRNVHQRIQLHYGEAYGLSYRYRGGGGEGGNGYDGGGGLVATITLPALRE